MSRIRSPNYPLISLPEAIERARSVYEKEHIHKTAPEVVAKALGYSGLNGKSLGLISTLKKYGLLEEVGKDLKISEAALTILVDPQDSPERAAAIRASAFMPALFTDLQKQYGETLPSDENIRAYLLKRGFTLGAVDAPIRAYRETIQFVTDHGTPYNDQETKESTMQQSSSDRIAAEVAKTSGMGIPKLPEATLSGARRDVFSLDEGQVILQWPEKMTSASYEDFKAWIDLQVRKIGRAVKDE